MTESINLLKKSPRAVARLLRVENIRRFCFTYDAREQKVKTSHPMLKTVANFLQNDKRDFMEHEGLFFQISHQNDILLGAFIHKTVRGQGAGGVRYWQYETFEDYLRDGLRLAKGMTRKNALAGIWWGGGKGVIAQNPALEKNDIRMRTKIYRNFGELVTSVNGCYVTAEDVGTNVDDMSNIFSTTRFTTCIPPEQGGSGNPSTPTARGVVCGMEGASEFLSGDTLAGKTVVVQGTGNVGRPLIRFLFAKNVGKIIACDINPANIKQVRQENSNQNLEAVVVSPTDSSILTAECDILAPCATGAILNAETIPQIKAKIICGAANNQLEDTERDGALLHNRGIIYVPDFLANRMGIVNCCNEQYGYVADDPAMVKHFSRDWEYSVFQTILRVLKASLEKGEPTAKVAIRQADALAEEPHPIFGHRGQQIIDSLAAENWACASAER